MNAFNFKKDKSRKKRGPRPAKKVDPKDLVDPVLYVGGLDPEKYPSLSQDRDDRVEEDAENPLNQR